MTSTRNSAALLAAALLLAGALPARAADKRLRWEKSWGPLVPHKKFPKDCGLCHVPKRWDVLRPDFKFDHLKETGYPLVGAHAQAACLRCHNDRGPVSAYVKRGCGGCHVDPHKGTLGIDCLRCHAGQESWGLEGKLSERIAAHARTRLPLTGMHAAVECRQCHVRADLGEYRGLPTDCLSCHRADYARAPNHAALGFPTVCAGCHTTTSWPTATFNHSVLPPGANCYACHAPQYAGAPGHVASGYPQACAQCHNTTTWLGAVFNHAFLGPSPVCWSCHQSAYQTAPNHVALSFSQSCLTCHLGTTSWLGAVYDHSSAPGYPNPVCWNCHQAEYASAKTTPASNHAANAFPTTCADCHVFTAKPPPWGPGTAMNHNAAGVGGTSASCQQCHLGDYASAASPVNHAANGIPANQCNLCHVSFATWTGFVHAPSSCFNSSSYAPHNGATCAQCHPGANYAAFSCAACHASNPGSVCN